VVADDPGIYVEILIGAGADEIWRCSQVPELHERWDLRFSAIDYLPKQADDESQPFRYSTRIGFGLKIEGEGESTGTREDSTGLRNTQRPGAYMIYSERRHRIVDYLGTHQHLAVAIDLRVASNGGLCLRSGAQRFYEGPVGC
jgi:hypothetical protein